MTTNSNIRLRSQENILGRNTFRDLRSPGFLAKRPLIGLLLFLFGTLAFSLLAYSVKPNGPLIQWDMGIAKTWRADALNVPGSLIEYLLFGFFLGKEMIATIGLILSVYFIHKRFWRELGMVWIGLGGGVAIWYFLSRYFDRPRPATPFDALPLNDPSFPSGLAIMAVLCYGLLAYLLIPKMPSHFWKWFVGIMLTIVILFVGFSGLLLGAHYVTDVIAGAALGLAWAGLIYTGIERFFPGGSIEKQERSIKRTSFEGLRAPGWFKKLPVIGLSMIILGSLAFAGLSYSLLSRGPLVQVDTTVYKELLSEARTAPPVVNEIMLFGFFLGKEVVQVIVTVLTLYFLHKRFWRELGMLWISSAVGSVIWNFIIAYFDRPRPPQQMGLPITTIPSFPSGHAMSALICYGFLAYLLVPKMPSRFWKWVVALGALLIVLFDGFSRVFQGNHYLTDVLAGYALGIAWAGLVYMVIERIFIKKEDLQNVEEK
jgi:membrane-associated phospholipid phosphatase